MGLRAVNKSGGVGQESISRSICHGMTRNQNTSFRAGSVSDGNTQPLGAVPKGSNGVVAVGLPHRNYSVLKQNHIN
jgi:hypothetical protein